MDLKPDSELPSRRRFLKYFSKTGLSATLLPGILWARFQEEEATKVTVDMLAEAERLAGLEFTDQERELMIDGLNEQLASYETIRKIGLDNSVFPALRFDPRPPGTSFYQPPQALRMSQASPPAVPSNIEGLAFWPVTYLSRLIRSRQITSLDLTKMYLERLRRFDPQLMCVVTLTEELALEQARRADEEIASGYHRGPLHGIPWGAKDLLATRRYKTTWGAMPYMDQTLDADATVVRRLEKAGAVLLAKLTLGALAMGDVWFGGKTRNPWNLEQGSSGSSAGSASATAAGLVAFSIGTETRGSIISPSTRCGVTGLRPTFGRVSRHGAMALSWSMDKIGPICRSVEDCALVFDAIFGPDGKDGSVVDLPFNWDSSFDPKGLKIGYVKSAFEAKRDDEAARENDQNTLEELRSLGFTLTVLELPDYPIEALSFILTAEAAAAFDDLTRSNQDDMLIRQVETAWPNILRQARLIPAVEYIQANRVRTQLMQTMHELISGIDVFVAPSLEGSTLPLTNLTGHPCVVVPNGLNREGSPTSISFVGHLYGEGKTLSVAKAYQDATEHHLKYPPTFQTSDG